MNLVSYKDPSLSRAAKLVTPEDVEMHKATTIPAMIDMVRETGAAGLTAPSIGLDLRFFVTKFLNFPVVINPQYSEMNGSGFISKPESSILRQGWSIFVRRSVGIHAEWLDSEGKEHAEDLIQMDARVFAHLCDSVNGSQLWEASQ